MGRIRKEVVVAYFEALTNYLLERLQAITKAITIIDRQARNRNRDL
jgi:hypothetical protein